MALAHRQLGSILFLTLIFSAAIAVMLLFILETAILDQKMLNHSLEKKKVHLDYLPFLASLEKQLADSFNVTASGVSVLEWVPDTLLCEESSGIRYYQITQQRVHPDGASSHFKSIYAVRGTRPTGMPHPNERYCHIQYVGLEGGDIEKSVNGRTSIIPLSKWLPISNIIGSIIFGKSRDGQGMLLYVLAQKKYHSEQVIVIVADEKNKAPYIQKIIDLESRIDCFLLRNSKLILHNDEWVMVLDAYSGHLYTQEKLHPLSESRSINESICLNMIVRKPRESTRLIQALTSHGWAQAEILIDMNEMGRKVWHEK